VSYRLRIALLVIMIASAVTLLGTPGLTGAFLSDTESAQVRLQAAGGDVVPPPAEGVTRTHGFWRSHPTLTEHIFTQHLDGSIDCGWTRIDSAPDLLGALDGASDRSTRRLTLRKARALCTRHYLAAVLSAELVNHSPVPVDDITGLGLIPAARLAMADGDRDECVRLAGLLVTFVESRADAGIATCGCEPQGATTDSPNAEAQVAPPASEAAPEAAPAQARFTPAAPADAPTEPPADPAGDTGSAEPEPPPADSPPADPPAPELAPEPAPETPSAETVADTAAPQ